MKSLIEVLAELKQRGYTEDFNLKGSHLHGQDGRVQMAPNEFQIDETFHFDVMDDPADNSVLYAISSADHKIKGTLINGYGIYSDDITNEMAAKLK